jgi:hypothetical protein
MEKMKITVGEIKIHDKLNPLLWEDHKLDGDVRAILISIADEFYKFLEISAPLKDIKFIGSLANYNYTSKSDIDLHLVVNYGEIDDNIELVRNYFANSKNLWNITHSITVRGYDVEVYVEDEGESPTSSGSYTVLNNTWIHTPQKSVGEIDTAAAEEKATKVRKEIIMATDMESGEDKLFVLRNLKQKIKKMRRCGLEKGGEYSVENIAFKILRNEGALGKLHNSYNREYDNSLTLPEEKIQEEEPYQRAVKNRHSRMKLRLIGLGKNKKKEKGHTRPSYKRSKSAPPGAGGT